VKLNTSPVRLAGIPRRVAFSNDNMLDPSHGRPWLADLCRRTGLSNRAVAKLAGIDPGDFSRLIHGRSYLGPERIARIARALSDAGIDAI